MRPVSILPRLACTLVLLTPVPMLGASDPAVPHENPSDALKQNAERGWFFYEQVEKPRELVKPPLALPPGSPKSTPTKEELCRKRETWTDECGFVDPGKDFEFQGKERDGLLQAMSMSHNDPRAVENFQYYMRWLMQRSIEVANLWEYNEAQNPDLDPTVKAPISTFGLRLMTQVRDSSEGAILGALKDQGAFLIYFSRSDCNFCLAMSSVLDTLTESTGLEIWDASLDDHCMTGYENRCKRGTQAVAAGQALQVAIVPTLFLYIPGGKAADDTWIRIATGISDAATMRGRIVAFFSAYRTALLRGVTNSQPGRAPVDFSDNDPSGTGPGVPTVKPLPTEAEIKALFAK